MPFASNNGCGGGAFFDLTPTGNLSINGFTINTSVTSGTAVAVTIYYKTNTYVGSELVAGDWTMHQSVSATSAGQDAATTVTINPLPLNGGQLYGIFVSYTGARYTELAGPTNFSNADLSVTLGTGACGVFTSTVNANRGFNGSVLYNATCATPRTPVKAVINTSGNTTWTGDISSAWETPGNWSCGVVPDLNTDVLIPQNATVIISTAAEVKSILVDPTASVTVKSGNSLKVTQ